MSKPRLLLTLFLTPIILGTANGATVIGDKNQIEVQAAISDVHEVRLYGDRISVASGDGYFHFVDSLQDGVYKYKVFVKTLVNNKQFRSFSDNGRTPEMRPSTMAILVAENGSFHIKNGFVLTSPSAAIRASQETLDSDSDALLELQILHKDDAFQTPPVKLPPVITPPVENVTLKTQSPAKVNLVNPFEVKEVSKTKAKKTQTPLEQYK